MKPTASIHGRDATTPAWFGLQGEPVINQDVKIGAAKVVRKYDPNDEDPNAQPIETIRFGLDGKPMNGAGGWAREVVTRDPATGEAKTVRYAADGTGVP